MLPGFSQLIAHRFRGFDTRENTIKGLLNALDYGVQLLEFDVRVAACGTPMVYHDEYARDKNGKKRYLYQIPAHRFSEIGGDFAFMPTLEDMLAAGTAHANKTAKFLIDIKDLGFESEVNALVHLNRIQLRTVYVSWVAEVLFRMAELAPDIPKCFSHWCAPVTPEILAKHRVFLSKDGIVQRAPVERIIGVRSGWQMDAPVKGDLLAVLAGGGICVPQDMITENVSRYYHKKNIYVSAFSYIETETMRAHQEQFNIDQYFIDKKDVFTKIKADN